MKKVSSRRPSPALLISLLALFVALGGSAYAANQLAKNSVGAKQLKKNAVTAAKLKNNAVTTPKIKNEAITGAKIKESSLGPVPNATHADTATTATNATNAENAKNAMNAVNATNFSRYHTSGLKQASIGETVPLLTVGPFSIVGKCTDGGGYPEARTYITTSQAGSVLESYEESYYEGDFDPGIEGEIGYYASNSTPEASFWEEEYTFFHAGSADGSTILQGYAFNSVNLFGAQCGFTVAASNMA